MRRWVVCCALLLGTIVGGAGLVAQRRAGAGAYAGGIVSIPVEVSFQVGPTMPGAIERHVTGGTQATIEARALSLAATTDADGHAELSKIPVSPEMQSEPARTDIVVTAPGYGTFTYLNVPLVPELGIILTPILGPEARTDDLGRLAPPLADATPSATPGGTTSATPGDAPAAAPSATVDATPPETPNATSTATMNGSPNAEANQAEALSVTQGVCTSPGGCYCDNQSHYDHRGSVDSWPPPPNPGGFISVYWNFSKYQEALPTCQVYRPMFKDYVKQVLPNEWLPGWLPNTYKAGAVAVKMYGWQRELYWYNVVNGQPYAVDSSTNFQVWDPTWDPYYETAPTNQAVEETWGYRLMTADGTDVYTTSYLAGYPSDSCDMSQPPYHPQLYGAPAPGDTMSQYGSEDCAERGWAWPYILAAYYFSPQSNLQLGCPQDADCDGVADWVDNCPYTYNPDQLAYDAGPRPGGPAIPSHIASNPAQDPQGYACDPDSPPVYAPCSSPDSDGDTIVDCIEHLYNTCAYINDGFVDYSTCANPLDSDGDNCPDWLEMNDVNGDRSANIIDVMLVAKRVADIIGPSWSDAVLDVNHDGSFNILDDMMVAKSQCSYRGYACPCTQGQ